MTPSPSAVAGSIHGAGATAAARDSRSRAWQRASMAARRKPRQVRIERAGASSRPDILRRPRTTVSTPPTTRAAEWSALRSNLQGRGARGQLHRGIEERKSAHQHEPPTEGGIQALCVGHFVRHGRFDLVRPQHGAKPGGCHDDGFAQATANQHGMFRGHDRQPGHRDAEGRRGSLRGTGQGGRRRGRRVRASPAAREIQGKGNRVAQEERRACQGQQQRHGVRQHHAMPGPRREVADGKQRPFIAEAVAAAPGCKEPEERARDQREAHREQPQSQAGLGKSDALCAHEHHDHEGGHDAVEDGLCRPSTHPSFRGDPPRRGRARRRLPPGTSWRTRARARGACVRAKSCP